MELYEVSDKYINYLRQYDNKVLDNHFVSHNRKYLGLGIELNDLFYYIPLSHPDSTDFVNGQIRPTVLSIFRMTTNKGRFLGKLLLNNMIPVPVSELTFYDINKETDLKYKNLVMSELRIIRANQSIIIKNANILYKQKKNGKVAPYINATVDFALLEEKMNEYVS